jgi:hypothetical protein
MLARWPIAPSVTRAAVLRDPTLTSGIGQFAVIQSVSQSLGVEVSPVNAGRPIAGIASCALAAPGHMTAAPPSSVMNSRRLNSSNCIRPRQPGPVGDIELARIRTLSRIGQGAELLVRIIYGKTRIIYGNVYSRSR